MRQSCLEGGYGPAPYFSNSANHANSASMISGSHWRALPLVFLDNGQPTACPAPSGADPRDGVVGWGGRAGKRLKVPVGPYGIYCDWD